jgi:hypothetical protein
LVQKFAQAARAAHAGKGDKRRKALPSLSGLILLSSAILIKIILSR